MKKNAFFCAQNVTALHIILRLLRLKNVPVRIAFCCLSRTACLIEYQRGNFSDIPVDTRR